MANDKEKRTASEIVNDVKDQLVWDTQVASTNVEVSVTDDGEVTLSGTVPSFSAKRAAELDAWGVSGVRSVTNEITVEYPEAVTVPTDSDIASNVESVLLWNPSIDSTDIEVSVVAGIVTLKGTVDSFWKKLHAEDIAADITGVLNVVNKLAVVPTDDRLDKDIATDIVDAMERKAAVYSPDVTVTVEDGVATISGTVPSFNAWSAAYDSARYTAGVVDVVDNLEIA